MLLYFCCEKHLIAFTLITFFSCSVMGGSSSKTTFFWQKKKKSPTSRAWRKLRRALPDTKRKRKSIPSLDKLKLDNLRREMHSQKRFSLPTVRKEPIWLKRLSLGNVRKEGWGKRESR